MTSTASESQPPTAQAPAWIAPVGWALFAFWATVLVAWGIFHPDPYAQGWRLVLELAFLGRLVNVADGVALGFSKSYLLFQSGLQDIILLLVAYPPLVAVCQGAAQKTFVGRRLEAVRQTAELHKAKVEPLGALGLWIFVFFPFWSTGALIGGVVGYLLGMRPSVVFASVFSGHVLSVVGLVYFFDAMAQVAEAFNSGAVKFLPWIVLAIVLVSALRSRRSRQPAPLGEEADGSS